MPIFIAVIIVMTTFIVGMDSFTSTINNNSSEQTEIQDKVESAQVDTSSIITDTSEDTLPTQAYSSPTPDPDPIIDCKFNHSGTKKFKKSACSQMVDCQLYGDTWVPATKEKCKLAQSEIASLLLNALKNKSSQYVQSVIDNYSSRSYGSYDYQPPYAMSDPSPSEPPKINIYGGSEMYTQIGDTTFGSEGDYQTRIGDTTFRSDGSYYTQIGDTVFDSDGSYHERLGDTIFSSDGSYSTQIGDTTFGSDGSYSTQIGDTTFIDP